MFLLILSIKAENKINTILIRKSDNMNKILKIVGSEILDSRGNPTVEVKVILKSGVSGVFSVPSGASKGEYEAYELKDNDIERYNGKGVLKAINNVNTIINDSLKDKDVLNQKEIDEALIKLDGSNNKANLGANAILGVSIACLKAACNSKKEYLFKYISNNKKYRLPTPMMNVINGGLHASNNLDIQEFMIVPINYNSIRKAIENCVKVFNTLKKILKENNYYIGVGDEGGFAPNLTDDEHALKLLVKSIIDSGFSINKDFKIAIDAASSEWYDNQTDTYYLAKSKKRLTKEELIDKWVYLVENYPILSIEDAMGETDIKGWKMLNEKLNDKVLLVGDDLFVTNIERLKMGINNNIANSILIKPNQIGTFSETIDAINLANKNNYKVIISHRSGETNDDFIADLAVAMNANYIKAGAPNKGERVAKYNRLMQIEDILKGL